MAIQAKRFNWVPKQSAWQQTQAWREKRAAMREQFAASSAALSAGFTQAMSGQITGLGDLAAQAAVKRQQAEYQAKVNKTFEAFEGLDMSV
jgi:hypothetical protein